MEQAPPHWQATRQNVAPPWRDGVVAYRRPPGVDEMSNPPANTESIDVVADNPASRIILNAIATFIKDAEFVEKFGGNGKTVDVVLLVNGHRVPVVETLADTWKRMDAMLERRASAKAIEMVTAAGLEPLAQALRDAENKIREKLEIWE